MYDTGLFPFSTCDRTHKIRENEIPNLLDLILSSDETMIQDLTYHPPLGESDHVCLRFKLLLSQEKEEFIPIHNVFKTN